MIGKRIVLLYGFTSVRVKLIKATLSALWLAVRIISPSIPSLFRKGLLSFPEIITAFAGSTGV